MLRTSGHYVYVTDTFNDRVEIFDADGANRQERRRPCTLSSGPKESPSIATAKKKWWTTRRIEYKFSKEGQLLIYFGMRGDYPGQFMGAYGIAIDKYNRVIVSETFPGRVQIFHYVSDADFEKEKVNQGPRSQNRMPRRPRNQQAAQMTRDIRGDRVARNTGQPTGAGAG